MAPAEPSQRVVRFGRFELDLHTAELRENGHRVRLQQQPFRVLAMLVSRPNDLVTRQELIEHLWPDGVVVDYEHSLNKAVRKLREALDDAADQPSYIETLSRRGYRFVHALDDSGAVVAPDAAPEVLPRRRGSRVWLVSSIAITASAIAATAIVVQGHLWTSDGTPEQTNLEKLVVLPFVNLSGDPGQELFCDALTEEMISELGSLNPERLGVIARTTAMQYKATRKTAREIGHELDVDYILESSLQRAGNRVRITTQLISAPDETHLWSRSYDRELGDMLILRRDVAHTVASAIRLQLPPRQNSRPDAPGRVNSKAYELYLTGMYYMEREWSPSAYERARQYFQQAIEADASFAPPYAALANIYVELRLWGLLPDHEARVHAKSAAEKAVELDNSLPDAHAALGNVKFMLEWDWWGAGEDFHRATQLHLSRLTGLRKYVRYLMLTGRTDEGLAFHRRMIELDPLSTDLRIVLGWTLQYARRYEDAIKHLEKMLEQEPDLSEVAHYYLAWNLAMAGRYTEAAAECEAIGDAQSCAYVYAKLGQRQKAMGLASRNAVRDPVFTAAAYVALGDKQRALQLLERGYREHLPAMVYIWAASALDPLRKEPAFKDLLLRMGFPPNQ